MTERIGEVGYINPEKRHALIGVWNPALINKGEDFVQIVLSIDGAIQLRAELNAFLEMHGVVAN